MPVLESTDLGESRVLMSNLFSVFKLYFDDFCSQKKRMLLKKTKSLYSSLTQNLFSEGQRFMYKMYHYTINFLCIHKHITGFSNICKTSTLEYYQFF